MKMSSRKGAVGIQASAAELTFCDIYNAQVIPRFVPFLHLPKRHLPGLPVSRRGRAVAALLLTAIVWAAKVAG